MSKSVRSSGLFLIPTVVLTLACTALGGPDVSVPTLAPAGDSTVLFRDDFSDTESGWDRVRSDEGVTDYEGGQYRIFVDKDLFDYWANPGRSFSDVRVEVDATKVGGSDNNDFGLICRYQDVENFYAFLISSDGGYTITKYSAGSAELLGASDWLASGAVNQGDATNRMRADCVGDVLTLYANDQLLHSVNDADFASGDVGLIAGTFEEPGTDILFDNFVVLEP